MRGCSVEGAKGVTAARGPPKPPRSTRRTGPSTSTVCRPHRTVQLPANLPAPCQHLQSRTPAKHRPTLGSPFFGRRRPVGRVGPAAMSGNPPRAGKPQKHTPIPTEWRIELPEHGAGNDSEFGGCRSIEAGYRRGDVLGQGTYGEVGGARWRAVAAACTPKLVQGRATQAAWHGRQ